MHDTVGKLASDLMVKEPESRDPIELQREMQKDYMKELVTTVIAGRQKFEGNFFVVVLTKNERLLPNVFRNYFFSRSSCPTPDYDQSVFWYKKDLEDLIYLWTIPSREASFYLKDNALKVVEEEKLLLDFILKFDDGTLYKVCKQLNGESDLIAKD